MGLVAFIAVMALGSIFTVAVAGPLDADVPMLTDDEFEVLGIQDAVEVTPGSGAFPAARVRTEVAVAVAYDELGVKGEKVRILHALTPRYVGEEPRTVWVVLFSGGQSPFGGPGRGSEPTQYRLTGIIVEDQTGEFLGGFMH